MKLIITSDFFVQQAYACAKHKTRFTKMAMERSLKNQTTGKATLKSLTKYFQYITFTFVATKAHEPVVLAVGSSVTR